MHKNFMLSLVLISNAYDKHKHIVKQKTKQLRNPLQRSNRHRHKHKQTIRAYKLWQLKKANLKENSFCYIFVNLRGKFIL